MTRCRKYRLLAELTQSEVAKRLRRTTAVISFYETGKRRLPLSIAMRMAKIYGCNWEDLYEEGENDLLENDVTEKRKQ